MPTEVIDLSQDPLELVAEFNGRSGSPQTKEFRKQLLVEEVTELEEALGTLEAALVHVLKELTDLNYVTLGTGEQSLKEIEKEDPELADRVFVTGMTAMSLFDGLTIAEAFKRVHESNMTKTPVEGGKPAKGEGYVEANLSDLVELVD
jgi:predicted HAD superfamily Cof-like phosphohydrolase